MNAKLISTVIDRFKEELSKPSPILVNTVFTPSELNTVLNLGLNINDLDELIMVLEILNIIQCTDKLSINESYFNIKDVFYQKYRTSKKDKQFVDELDNKILGFCIINAKQPYRQECRGKSCKYYLSHDRICILGKFFV